MEKPQQNSELKSLMCQPKASRTQGAWLHLRRSSKKGVAETVEAVMSRIDVHQAKDRLEELIEQAAQGEEGSVDGPDGVAVHRFTRFPTRRSRRGREDEPAPAGRPQCSPANPRLQSSSRCPKAEKRRHEAMLDGSPELPYGHRTPRSSSSAARRQEWSPKSPALVVDARRGGWARGGSASARASPCAPS